MESAVSYFRRLRVIDFLNRVSRYETTVKAGSSEDCGHRPRGGLFATGNTCAGEGSEKAGPHSLKNWHKGKRLSDKDLPEDYRGILSKEEIAAITNADDWNEMVRLADKAVANKAGYLPTVEELKILSKMGQSTRGQYEYGGKFLRASFADLGKEKAENIARFWEAANSIFSARTGWKIHSAAATMLMSLWVEQGMPTGNSKESIDKIDEIVDFLQNHEKPNGAIAFPIDGVKANKARKLMMEASSLMDDKKMKKLITAEGFGKTVNFGEAWTKKLGVAVDSWMGAATTPENIFSDDPMEINMSKLMDMTSDNPKLKGDAKDLDKRLRDARMKVMSDPKLYNSYKLVIAKAAEDMGMEPREVQETAWSALMGIGMLRAAGLKSGNIVDNFTHELAKHSWDMEGVLNDQAFSSGLRKHGASGTALDRLAAWSRRITGPRREATGRVELSPEEREIAERVAGRVPAAAGSTTLGRSVLVPDEVGGLKTLKEWIPKESGKVTPLSIAKKRADRAERQAIGAGINIRKMEEKIAKRGETPKYLDQLEMLREKARKAHENARQKAADVISIKEKKKSRSRSGRRLHRFAALTGPASLPRCEDDETHGLSDQTPHYLSSEQVGYIIAHQHHNLPKHYTAREMEHEWTASTLFKLISIPSWVASPYRRIESDDHSRSGGPIIVDLKLDDFDKFFGSFGQDIGIVILDGKHRRNDLIQEHGDFDIDAYVGTEAIPRIREYVKEYGPKRERFIDALGSFYDNPNRGSWRDLVRAGRRAGLSARKLRLIRVNLRRGWLFSPSMGEFVRNHRS